MIVAGDGFEALDMIVDRPPRILFVDIMMPRLDGHQTWAPIKHKLLFKHTPVIMPSCWDGLFDKARGGIPGGDVAVTIDALYGQRSFLDEQAIPARDLSESPLRSGRYAHFVDRGYRLADHAWGCSAWSDWCARPSSDKPQPERRKQ